MKRSRFSEPQIVGILREAETGVTVKELCRKHEISDATFYTWRERRGIELRYIRPGKHDQNAFICVYLRPVFVLVFLSVFCGERLT